MLSSADLLEMAEAFADRIPGEPAYSEERAVIWRLVGEQYLRSGDPEAARRALRALPSGESEAEFRCSFAKWAGAHPEADVGRAVLRETIAGIDRLDPWLTRRDFVELTPIAHALLGESQAHFVAERVEEIPEDLLAQAVVAIKNAEAVMAGAKELLTGNASPPEVSADSPSDLLSRYLHYRQNDLKVRWLVDGAARGGVDDAALESRLASEEFQRVESPRQPGIEKDPTHLGPADFAAFLFDRPVPLKKSDEELLRGERHAWDDPDKTRMVTLATQMFLDFGAIGRRYSPAQIDQGLWFLFGFPHSFGEYLEQEDVPIDLRVTCIEAMIVPFRDYLQHTPDDAEGAFYMWWDLVGLRGPQTVPVARRVLEQILNLSGWPCQKAALHGLNHLRPKAETSTIVGGFLVKQGSELTTDQLAYAELCRDCRAQ